MGADAAELLRTWKTEYVDHFVSEGGAAAKVVVADAGDRSSFINDLQQASLDANFRFAHVSGYNVRIHLIQQLFFALSRQITGRLRRAAS